MNVKLTCKVIFTLNIGTIPRIITGKNLDIWDKSLYLNRQRQRRFMVHADPANCSRTLDCLNLNIAKLKKKYINTFIFINIASKLFVPNVLHNKKKLSFMLLKQCHIIQIQPYFFNAEQRVCRGVYSYLSLISFPPLTFFAEFSSPQ